MLEDFDYHLPKERIAQKPLTKRSSSRLMVLTGRGIEHKKFYDLLDYLDASDVLAINDTKVIPARLRGRKASGGKVEALLLKKHDSSWECLVKGKNIQEGMELVFKEIKAKVLQKKGGRYILEFQDNLEDILESIGEIPTPPYIKEKLVDGERYQTIYAERPGSIAAPTAGLHFTSKLLRELERRGINIARITLHIGFGTFAPVRVQELSRHRMEPEYFEVTEESASTINHAREEGKLIIVGTSTLKALESASDRQGNVQPTTGWSDLFIHPPYEFRVPSSGLLTNFHLPKSTLLMLVCAYAGRERILEAYGKAVEKGYKFYSFGDAMLIMRHSHV
ncbi:MAG: tRNA preQ1(34) S-adenosylmethionine ribosyltransferase-isomerase QueA [Candidatus Hydrothermarchaeales archaeon]